MCTVIASVDPDSEVPVLLAGVRDEFVSRPWMSPGFHWPAHPGLLGGIDLQAGGTWLAACPRSGCVAALLNGHGVPAPEQIRLSRGDLPLRAAEAGEMPPVDLTRYDPFHLVLAGLDGVRMWSWDGERLRERKLTGGLHMIVNSGLGDEAENQRVAWFRPRFAALPRPPRLFFGAPRRFWGEWLDLAAGGGLPPGDPHALIVRHDLGDGRIFASLSVTLVALGQGGLRYDFLPFPPDPRTWHAVEIPREHLGDPPAAPSPDRR